MGSVRSGPEQTSTSEPAGTTPATVLVVDDTEIIRRLFTLALGSDYRVLSAESGEAALQIASRDVPDLILLDVMMPCMDGFATAEALGRDPILRDVPIIFLTALSDKDAQIRGLELGAVDFLTKPVNLTVLRKRVGNVIERERLRAQTAEHQQALHELLIKQTEAHNTLESVFNASNDALIVTTCHFDILQTNGNVRTLFACEPGSLRGTSLRRFAFRDSHDNPVPLEEIPGAESPHECTLHTPEGRSIPVSVTGRSFSSGGGDVNYLFSVHDISRRLAFERERRHANEMLHEAVLELGMQKEALDEHALVSITDARGVITYANEKFCATSGHSVEGLVGRTHRLIKSGEHPPEFYADIWRTITAGRTWHGEIANRAKDGHVYWVASTIVPWVNKDGVPYQYVAICTDISDRYRAEQQLALSRARELEIGAAIQHRLLFGAPPARLVGVAVACYTEASQGVDGDFYTFTRLSSSAFEVLAGDVMGKGVTAALIAAGVKSAYLRQLSELMAKRQGANPPSPATLVNAIHAAVTPELINVGSFVTLSLLRFDRKALTVTWVNAGHTPTLLARAGGQEVIELLGENLPLGVLEEEHYVEHVTHLGIGDTLLNYSDGLSESVNEENIQYGTERIKRILGLGQRALAAPSITLNSLRSEIHDYTHSTSDCDDRTGIIVQIRPVRKPPRGSVTGRRAAEYLDIPRQLDKLGPLRQRIAALGAEQPEEIVQPLVLAAFEAATNIIRHTPEKLTAAPLTALLCRDAGTLSVELVYEGKPFAPPSNLEPDFSGDSEGGFGLYIIENSVDKIEYGAPMPGMVSIRLVKNLAGTVA